MDLEIKSFDQWVATLSSALDKGKMIGMSQDQIISSAKMLGNFLADSIQPDAPENRAIKSLWEQGSDNERQALASMMVKLVEQQSSQQPH